MIISLFVKHFKSFMTEVPILSMDWFLYDFYETSVMKELRELLKIGGSYSNFLKVY